MGLEPKKKRRRSPRQGPRKPLAVRNAKGQNAPLFITDEMRRKVENLVAADFSTIEIAGALNMSTASLEKHFREELVGGRNRVHTDIAHGILQGARDGDRTLQIYASKARMGWRERSVGVSAPQNSADAPPATTLRLAYPGDRHGHQRARRASAGGGAGGRTQGSPRRRCQGKAVHAS
jgi:hypothetical protein